MSVLRNISFGFALLGLILAPLAPPAMAVPAHEHAIVTDQASMAMEMPADMPCCPHKAPGKDCAKDCPLMALCMANIVLSLPANNELFFPLKFVTLAISANDPDITGINCGPPPRPPRT